MFEEASGADAADEDEVSVPVEADLVMGDNGVIGAGVRVDRDGWVLTRLIVFKVCL